MLGNWLKRLNGQKCPTKTNRMVTDEAVRAICTFHCTCKLPLKYVRRGIRGGRKGSSIWPTALEEKRYKLIANLVNSVSTYKTCFDSTLRYLISVSLGLTIQRRRLFPPPTEIRISVEGRLPHAAKEIKLRGKISSRVILSGYGEKNPAVLCRELW